MMAIGFLKFKGDKKSAKEVEEVRLSPEECEAIRLKDYTGLSQSECAESMGISQPTFHRILVSARKKIADGLVNGKSINLSE